MEWFQATKCRVGAETGGRSCRSDSYLSSFSSFSCLVASVAASAATVTASDREATAAEYAARRTRNRNGPVGKKRANAMRQRDRIARILFFLRHRSPAIGATKEDDDLCNLLTQQLQARGEW